MCRAFICVFVVGASAAGAAELNVFAAASLADALREIAPLHAKATGDRLRFNFAASGTLARQIREGAPADVFLSADVQRIDRLQGEGMVILDTRRDLLSNQLVLVVAAEDGAKVSTLSQLGGDAIRRIGIGDPATVPAGAYTRAHLEHAGLWPALEQKTIPLANVRAVLAAVASGNVDAGFVYRTDALASSRVRIAVEVPIDEGPRIVYAVAVIGETRVPEAARAFVEFLAEPEAQVVFGRHGFLPPRS